MFGFQGNSPCLGYDDPQYIGQKRGAEMEPKNREFPLLDLTTSLQRWSFKNPNQLSPGGTHLSSQGVGKFLIWLAI